MGNQARVADNATVFSTSTRNFDNRMGKGARVYSAQPNWRGLGADWGVSDGAGIP